MMAILLTEEKGSQSLDGRSTHLKTMQNMHVGEDKLMLLLDGL
jgi:hypothetical protein